MTTILALAFVWSISLCSLQAQNQPAFAPLPTAQKCGASAIKAGAPDTKAAAILKQVMSVMDPAEAYRGINKFAITGSLLDDIGNGNAQVVGSFRTEEDHSIPNGDYLRQAVTERGTNTVRRKGGKSERNSSESDPNNDVSKLPFIPKYYVFPLAILAEEIGNPSISVHLVADSPMTTKPGLSNLIHLQIANTADSKSRKYEIEDWYIDRSTYLPKYVGHQLPTIGNALTCVEVFTEYESYQTMSGSLVPTKVTTHHGTKTHRVSSISSLTY